MGLIEIGSSKQVRTKRCPESCYPGEAGRKCKAIRADEGEGKKEGCGRADVGRLKNEFTSGDGKARPDRKGNREVDRARSRTPCLGEWPYKGKKRGQP